MTNEQIQERAEKLTDELFAEDEGTISCICDRIADALREARDEALEEAAGVAARYPFRSDREELVSDDIASEIRKLKGADHEG